MYHCLKIITWYFYKFSTFRCHTDLKTSRTQGCSKLKKTIALVLRLVSLKLFPLRKGGEYNVMLYFVHGCACRCVRVVTKCIQNESVLNRVHF